MASFIRGDHYIYFADGTTSQIADKRKFTDDAGVSKWRFLVWPSRKQKVKYNLAKDDFYDSNNDIVMREFKAYNVVIIENNPGCTRIWVFTDFNGHDTDLTTREAYLSQLIDYLEKEVKSLRTTVAALHEQLHMERTNQLQAMEDKVAIVKSARKAAGRTGAEGEDGAPEDSMGGGQG
jgi:hypothetical protein